MSGKSTAGTGRAAILLVEDDPVLRNLVAEILQSLHYVVYATGSPSEALAITDSAVRIDVLLTDLALPEMNGRDLAVAVLERRPGIRIVFSSGHPSDEALRWGLPANSSFIEKPYMPADLDRLLHELLERDLPAA